MKLASEEARAHPTRTNDASITSNSKSLTSVHDTKLTFCLETYVQWFNRLTFFVTTEIVKHTQRRVRIRLINYFLDAAYECLRLRNFNSMIAILGRGKKELEEHQYKECISRWFKYATSETFETNGKSRFRT